MQPALHCTLDREIRLSRLVISNSLFYQRLDDENRNDYKENVFSTFVQFCSSQKAHQVTMRLHGAPTSCPYYHAVVTLLYILLITPISRCTLHSPDLWSLLCTLCSSPSHSALSSAGLHAAIQLSYSTESWWSDCSHCHPVLWLASCHHTRLWLARVLFGGCAQ